MRKNFLKLVTDTVIPCAGPVKTFTPPALRTDHFGLRCRSSIVEYEGHPKNKFGICVHASEDGAGIQCIHVYRNPRGIGKNGRIAPAGNFSHASNFACCFDLGAVKNFIQANWDNEEE